MNSRGVLFLLGRLLLALTVALLAPAGVALYRGGGEARAFLISAGLAGVAGLVLQRVFRQPRDFAFGRREAFVLVSAAWVTASIVGALPYVLIKGTGFAIDALFESASGFTTTGASVLVDVEAEPAPLLLWRSLSQWLGGMGIIVLGIAILPKLAVGGMELLGAEAPGPLQQKLTPRIAQTAKALWGIYALLTLLEAVALLALGMSPLDSVSHAFSTMATGGFSTKNASIAAFGAPIQMVVVLFMMLAGANFALHFHLLRGRPQPLLRDQEFRYYIGFLAGGALLLGTDLLLRGTVQGWESALRLGAFQATSIVTTTGFATANFDAWPSFSRVVLFLLM
ncbi:MAG: TrkH family potassium uptake protein, partial [Planctomycetota bacterium]